YIIEAYLDENEPIGSAGLGLRMDNQIPASTIRVYFKKLSDIGALEQLHVSSGRIPTIKAMKRYWENKLSFDNQIKISNSENLSEILDKFKIYCLISPKNSQTLKEVINYSHKFIILNFDESEFILKFDEKVFNFFLNLIGITLDELEHVCSQIGLSDLRLKLSMFKRANVLFTANATLTYEIYNDSKFELLLDPNFINFMRGNIAYEPLFERGFMGVKREVKFNDKNATMLCAGSVYEDWEKFFDIVMEAA
ncbi:MAG: HrcA family transcriptional regulator, partial [Campylobacter sp.]|nr:HrcA family transcriptional regulator [Campylobacter sp.]